jgi:hypothetical protein
VAAAISNVAAAHEKIVLLARNRMARGLIADSVLVFVVMVLSLLGGLKITSELFG